MNPVMRLISLLLLAILAPSLNAASPEAGRKLVIGTHEAPPFAMKSGDGRWSGLSIELWQEVAAKLGLDYEWRELEDPEALVGEVEAGRVDASVAAITVTAERAEKVDFTQPYFNAGLGIVVPAKRESGWLGTARAFLSLSFLKVVGALTLVLLGAGFGVWIFERRRNSGDFGGTAAQGLGSAFWWAAVTMTTVGYGDKAPRTLGGRLIALVWMFTSVIIISTFTAQITSSLTLNRLSSAVHGPADLPRIVVATVGESAANEYLNENHVRTVAASSVERMLAAISEGTAQAGVYDAPILQYLLLSHPSLQLLPGTFEHRGYAIALPQQSPLRKRIDIALLEVIQGAAWKARLKRTLGTPL